jgi:hypothetical protein
MTIRALAQKVTCLVLLCPSSPLIKASRIGNAALTCCGRLPRPRIVTLKLNGALGSDARLTAVLIPSNPGSYIPGEGPWISHSSFEKNWWRDAAFAMRVAEMLNCSITWLLRLPSPSPSLVPS